MIVPFEPWHLEVIQPQAHQFGCHQNPEHARNLAQVGAFTCMDGLAPVAVGGIVPMEKYGLVFDSGIGQAWMVIAQGIPHKWSEIYKAARRELFNGLHHYHRIEATTTFPEGERLFSMLGMKCEGRLKKFNFKGNDVSLWAITR